MSFVSRTLPAPPRGFTDHRLAAARAALAAPADHDDAVLYEACWIVAAYSMDQPEIADAAALAEKMGDAALVNREG
ncbi:hypothetical protein MALG_01635 [Marinovum algicola DG 898]|nr:hypothetical protein MALG_01635 [Marinovum algicola DG 898]